MNRCTFLSIAGVGVCFFLKQLYDALNRQRKSRDNMVASDDDMVARDDIMVSKDDIVAKDVLVAKDDVVVKDEMVAKDDMVAKDADNGTPKIRHISIRPHDSLPVEDGSSTLSLQDLFNANITFPTPRPQSTLYQTLINPDDHLYYVILINKACELTPAELIHSVHIVSHRSQQSLKSRDPSVFEEWIQTGKRSCVFKVLGEGRLFGLHAKARKLEVTRVMFGRRDVMVVLGLGPSRVRDFRKVL